MNARESMSQIGHGLAVMWKGGSAASRILRAAALYLVAFTVVTTLVGHFAGAWWRFVVSAAGLAGILLFTRQFGREPERQDTEESAGENS